MGKTSRVFAVLMAAISFIWAFSSCNRSYLVTRATVEALPTATFTPSTTPTASPMPNTPTKTVTAVPSTATFTFTVTPTVTLTLTPTVVVVTGCPASKADNLCAGNLYNWYESQSGNIFFSPFSIITALAMVQEGANGPTATQMQTALNLSSNPAVRQPDFQQLIAEINSPGKHYTLSTANNVWVQQNFPVLASYLNTVETYYDAGVTSLDLVGNPNGSSQTIDAAVSMETQGYIPNLISPSFIQPNTRLILTNAIYFKATWASQFVTTGTYQQDFYTTASTSVPVSMMHQTLQASLSTFNGAASVLALPYQANEATMYIFLPPQGGMPQSESFMSGANINSWLSSLSGTGFGGQVELSLPKFKFSTNYDLTTPVSQLMPLAFTPFSADLSGIDGHLDLYISEVVHQAYVDVDETGTTAAAATGVGVGTTSIAYTPPPIVFTVDHPFIFMIVENTSNTVLFMGRVNDPTAN